MAVAASTRDFWKADIDGQLPKWRYAMREDPAWRFRMRANGARPLNVHRRVHPGVFRDSLDGTRVRPFFGNQRGGLILEIDPGQRGVMREDIGVLDQPLEVLRAGSDGH